MNGPEEIVAFCKGKLSRSTTAALPNRPIILVLNDYEPTASLSGGAARIMSHCSALSLHYKVIILCFNAHATLSVELVFEQLIVIRVPRSAEHIKADATANANGRASASDVISSIYVSRNLLMQLIYRNLMKECRLVIIEHPYMIELTRLYGGAFVYSAHNNEYRLKCELLRKHPMEGRLLGAVLELEDYALSNGLMTSVVSEFDALDFIKRLRAHHAQSDFVVVPNGAAASTQPCQETWRRTDCVTSKSIVFLGSNHLPNNEAARFIVEQLVPNIPDANFEILGSVCDSLGDLGSDAMATFSNLRLWGVVSDELKSAVLSRASMSLNPVTTGGGSNVKISDYMAHGLLTVSTPFGLRGYHSSISQYVVQCELGGFADSIRSQLASGLWEDETGRNERILYHKSHLSLLAISGSYASLITHLIERRPFDRLALKPPLYSFYGGQSGC
jgi:hypothetical protein